MGEDINLAAIVGAEMLIPRLAIRLVIRLVRPEVAALVQQFLALVAAALVLLKVLEHRCLSIKRLGGPVGSRTPVPSWPTSGINEGQSICKP